MNDFQWKWRDEFHLEAHKHDFLVPVEKILQDIKPIVYDFFSSAKKDISGEPVWFHEDFELDYETGLSGVKKVAPDSSESFWAYRLGRKIPSHLCLGEKQPTKSLCLWGMWMPETFLIHTIYAGTTAPREIHDPEIRLSELPEAIDFWRTRALIVKEGEFSELPKL
ncbi:MAG: hypothetical protein PQJ46_00525 [Spirochaetales bacterium]|nr:hypothetical protein [Spirochaetales bacterium]